MTDASNPIPVCPKLLTVARIVGRPKIAPPNTEGINHTALVRLSDGSYRHVDARLARNKAEVTPAGE